MVTRLKEESSNRYVDQCMKQTEFERIEKYPKFLEITEYTTSAIKSASLRMGDNRTARKFDGNRPRG